MIKLENLQIMRKQMKSYPVHLHSLKILLSSKHLGPISTKDCAEGFLKSNKIMSIELVGFIVSNSAASVNGTMGIQLLMSA